VSRGSGTSVGGSVLGVNSGRGSAFVVLGICKLNPDGSRKVPSVRGRGEERRIVRAPA
jgi:hypothetical protein